MGSLQGEDELPPERGSIRSCSYMTRASNLGEALRILDPRPLNFSEDNPQGNNVASNRAFYTEPPKPQGSDGFKLPGPTEDIRRKLLRSTRETKLFLSGHIGSGKSTELSRLAIQDEIQRKFSVVTFRFEEHEWATIDSTQVIFRVAASLFQKFKGKISGKKAWQSKIESLNKSIFHPMGMGLEAKEGALDVEFDLLILKLKQNLKFSEKTRQQFREFGETQRSVLQDFVQALVDDIEEALSREEDAPGDLLVIVDDLDKARNPEQQKELFETNLNALLALPLRVVFTLPTGVLFGGSQTDIRANVSHLYPVRVLNKAPQTFKPEDAFTNERLGFFKKLLEHRVNPGLVTDQALELAVIHSGGVLREFFRLLKEGANLAVYNDMDKLDKLAMSHAIQQVRLAESIGLYAADYEVLAQIHRSNELPGVEDRRYLDLARVIECYNGAVWFDVNPLLWPLLEEHSRRKNAQSPQPPPSS